jgi:hypothetical protein
MENVGIFYDLLEYITAIWYTLWSLGNFVAILVYFSPVLVYCLKKTLATLGVTYFHLHARNSTNGPLINACGAFRVTRLGEFSPFWANVSLGCFF